MLTVYGNYSGEASSYMPTISLANRPPDQTSLWFSNYDRWNFGLNQ
jgi:hypothetical protein